MIDTGRILSDEILSFSAENDLEKNFKHLTEEF